MYVYVYMYTYSIDTRICANYIYIYIYYPDAKSLRRRVAISVKHGIAYSAAFVLT